MTCNNEVGAKLVAEYSLSKQGPIHEAGFSFTKIQKKSHLLEISRFF
jgi:hypothetical protein